MAQAPLAFGSLGDAASQTRKLRVISQAWEPCLMQLPLHAVQRVEAVSTGQSESEEAKALHESLQENCLILAVLLLEAVSCAYLDFMPVSRRLQFCAAWGGCKHGTF